MASLSLTSSFPVSYPASSHNTHVSSVVNTLPSIPSSTLSTNVPVISHASIPSSCANVAAFKAPIVTADGWKAVKVAGSLTAPRGITFDTAGRLLVVQSGFGITAHTISPDGCLNSTKTLISQKDLNHGIAFSTDGKTLYASSSTTVFAWDYNAKTLSVGSTSRTVVSGMLAGGHSTRTLAISPLHPNVLVVSHGSNGNLDYAASDIKTARACVKGFDLSKTPSGGYDYVSQGWNLGYGLRNEVGLEFDPNGLLWGAENSADDLERKMHNGTTVDIHQDNPAEELNFLGDPSRVNQYFYGYPLCFSAWKPSLIPESSLRVGEQFVLAPNATMSDASCNRQAIRPVFAVQAHSAPLDIKFNKDYSSLFMTLHGSWDRQPATGYKVIEIPFTRIAGFSVPKTVQTENTTGYSAILSNVDEGSCSGKPCFRPVGIARDSQDRMYVSSDSSAEGEILLLGKVA